MAAYAALVSLMHIIDQIQHHPRPPIHLDEKQVESLTEKVTFLQDFLESYSNNHGSADSDALESHIADAAYAAEDIIESHLVDRVLAVPSSSRGEKLSSINFYQLLQKVILDMDLIKKNAMKIKERMGIQDQLRRISISSGSLRPRSTGHNTVVGLDDVKFEIMDKLTAQQCDRHIIPIVGMGGIGKTTLAHNIYLDPLIKHHFDILAWATISQDYNAKEILLDVLLCLENEESRESLNRMSEHELGEKLYKSLIGRRYMIVMDDIWSVDAWDRVKFFFPDNINGSGIIITTRLSNLAFQLTGTLGLKMNFLDEDKSWNLLCKKVFGGEDNCPIELVDVGKKIAKNCKGLPLSIVVIGGLLVKSKPTRENWQYVAENLNSIVKSEDDEHCLKILQMSYNQLPVHLKPCFLYMGVFPEDCEIHVSNLMRLWVAEGFLKPISGKSLEVVAEEYFNELIDRNLVLVSRRGYGCKIKYCRIHDLLMDLCIREAQKHKFLCPTRLLNLHTPRHISTQRRVAVHEGTAPRVIHTLRQSASFLRSFTRKSYSLAESSNFRLLRVWNGYDRRSDYSNCYLLTSNHNLVNCRYIDSLNIPKPNSPICPFWNLQTLIVSSGSASIEALPIWTMPQLRYVKFDLLHLPDPLSGDNDDLVLENLQKLATIRNFKCREEVVNKIPNIKKLRLFYDECIKDKWSSCHLKNLGGLKKLESFSCLFSSRSAPSRSYLLQNLILPHSLKKLTLWGSGLQWEDMTMKIGSLPNLEVLKLNVDSFEGPEWETVEGQFCSLKFLEISCCIDFERWITDSDHFPCLEQLVLRYLRKLEEIPLCIGDIPMLRSIELEYCSDGAVVSARDIVEEQEGAGNEDIRVRVVLSKKDEVLESLSSRNFQVKIKELIPQRRAKQST